MVLSSARRAAWAMAPQSAMRNVLRRKMRRTGTSFAGFPQLRSWVRTSRPTTSLSLARRRAAAYRGGTGVPRALAIMRARRMSRVR